MFFVLQVAFWCGVVLLLATAAALAWRGEGNPESPARSTQDLHARADPLSTDLEPGPMDLEGKSRAGHPGVTGSSPRC